MNTGNVAKAITETDAYCDRQASSGSSGSRVSTRFSGHDKFETTNREAGVSSTDIASGEHLARTSEQITDESKTTGMYEPPHRFDSLNQVRG